MRLSHSVLLGILFFFPFKVWSKSLGSSVQYTLDQHWLSQSQNGQKFLTLGSLLLKSGREYKGFRVQFSVLGNHGGHSPSQDIGDGQYVSNIDTQGVESIKVYELNIGKKWSNLEFLVGWYDLSTRFNFTGASQLFVQSSFGTTADWALSGFKGPSLYPQVSFGSFLWAHLTPQIYFGAAIMDPLTPENYYPKQLQTHILLNETNHMSVAELGYKNADKFHVGVGFWNMEQEQRSARPRQQQTGGYAMISGKLGSRFEPFLRYGKSSERAGRVFENRVAGLNIQKLFAKSRLDEFGFGYSAALLEGAQASEEAYELIYRLNYTSRLSFALSSQYVINPFYSSKDGQVMTLRVQIKNSNQQ